MEYKLPFCIRSRKRYSGAAIIASMRVFDNCKSVWDTISERKKLRVRSKSLPTKLELVEPKPSALCRQYLANWRNHTLHVHLEMTKPQKWLTEFAFNGITLSKNRESTADSDQKSSSQEVDNTSKKDNAKKDKRKGKTCCRTQRTVGRRRTCRRRPSSSLTNARRTAVPR